MVGVDQKVYSIYPLAPPNLSFLEVFMVVSSENRGVSPKMDGENNGIPYFLMDDLGVPHKKMEETNMMIFTNVSSATNHL